jgi:hypothetical protein
MRFLALPLLALVLALPVGAQTKKAAPEKEAKEVKIKWDGEWALLPDDSDKLEPLIEEHLKDQNFAMKVYWKKKLKNACQSPQTLDILYSGAEFSVTFGRERPAESSPDGTASEWKRADGEAFQVTLRKDGPRMTQTFQGDGYSLTNVYSMRKDGQTLALQVTYAHPKLNALSYKLVYKRVE